MSRQIVLDTETTGLSTEAGHRVLEIGCVEIIDRKITGSHFWKYINPERESDAQALAVHGISSEFLQDKPKFAEIADDFLAYVQGAELIIHNAPFDVGFLHHEFNLLDEAVDLYQRCTVTDSLVLAKHQYPGGRNNLDALCARLGVDNTGRDLHGALLDAQILAEVYLLMTGGQVDMSLDLQSDTALAQDEAIVVAGHDLKVVQADAKELEAHQKFMHTLTP